MISTALIEIENDLRRATGRRNYADVQSLLVALGAAAEKEARAFSPGDPRVYEIAAWLNQLWDWTGIMLRTARAEHADELRLVPFVKTYLRQRSLSNL